MRGEMENTSLMTRRRRRSSLFSVFLLCILLNDVLLSFRSPDDWTLSWGGSGQILGWGHNHRGQLGGVEGAKVKLPVGCEGLASLRPIQLIGGEQTLFAVTGDGKVGGIANRL